MPALWKHITILPHHIDGDVCLALSVFVFGHQQGAYTMYIYGPSCFLYTEHCVPLATPMYSRIDALHIAYGFVRNAELLLETMASNKTAVAQHSAGALVT